MQIDEWNLSAAHPIIDRDSKFAAGFEAVFEADGAKIVRVGPAAPNLNAFAERWVRTLRQECLDHFVICGEAHLRHLVSEFVAYYNEERPHQGVGNVPLSEIDHAAEEPPILAFPSREVKCHSRLGGLLKHYFRAAA